MGSLWWLFQVYLVSSIDLCREPFESPAQCCIGRWNDCRGGDPKFPLMDAHGLELRELSFPPAATVPAFDE